VIARQGQRGPYRRRSGGRLATDFIFADYRDLETGRCKPGPRQVLPTPVQPTDLGALRLLTQEGGWNCSVASPDRRVLASLILALVVQYELPKWHQTSPPEVPTDRRTPAGEKRGQPQASVRSFASEQRMKLIGILFATREGHTERIAGQLADSFTRTRLSGPGTEGALRRFHDQLSNYAAVILAASDQIGSTARK
jgi:hypothetical protein